VRLTDFWARMETQFGSTYARSVASDFRLPTLGATIDEAIERGDETKVVWRAVCEAFDLPSSVR
jgi:hypothetical protein